MNDTAKVGGWWGCLLGGFGGMVVLFNDFIRLGRQPLIYLMKVNRLIAKSFYKFAG
jgi:hypothetical protein